MSKKINYESPHMEIVETRMESNILTISTGVLSATNITTNAMTEDSSTINSWDAIY